MSIYEWRENHSCESNLYKLMDSLNRSICEATFGENGICECYFDKLGLIRFPYFEMGAINSAHLFGLDELIIFNIYVRNRGKYQKIADIGANIGLHSIVLALLGFEVHAFEPDPVHIAQLLSNLELNSVCSRVTVREVAVSNRSGKISFSRILGNTTSSHITGAKPNPYGPIEVFDVHAVPFSSIVRDFDLLKLDVEGHESELITSTTTQDWENTDVILEIGSAENARAIFQHLNALGVSMYSQKKSWKNVDSLTDVPTSYKEGSLFATVRETGPW